MPENFEIAHFWVFWLIPLPLLVYWILPSLKVRSAALLLPNFRKAAEYTGHKPMRSAMVKRRNFIVWILLSITWILTLTTLSSPQLVGEPELKVKTSRNFLVVADISFSMAQTDWQIDGQRVTRWEAVKSVLNDFVEKREGDRIGLIFFGSSAYIQLPFTSDLTTFSQMLEEADVGMAGQMTHIGKAIVKGIDMFRKDSIDTKVMLLLTDGVDAGTDILPLDATEMARKDSILVYTIGIGDPTKPGADLDERTLEEISGMTGAQYFRAHDAVRLEEIYEELDRLEPIEFEEEAYKPRTLLYYYPLGAAILLMLLMAVFLSSASFIRMLINREGSHD